MAITHLAEKSGVVVAAYIVAFFPWGFMYLRQFLRPGCRNKGNTACARRLFLILSICCCPGLAYLMFYTHLQRITERYNEMCLAIYAIFFILAHVVRTIVMFLNRQEETDQKLEGITTFV